MAPNGMWSTTLTVVLTSCVHLVKPSRSLVEKDVCMADTFTAECREHEVVVMETAMYGRMAFGGCVKTNLGYVGCQSDVLTLADRWCSGRQSCSVPVPTDELESLNPCLHDLRTYLQASYRCLRVATGIKDYSMTRQMSLLGSHGYLSSWVAFSTRHGTPRTPWVIEALPGQTITLTLLDFGIWRLQGEIVHQEGEQADGMYAFIYEPATGANRSVYSSGDRQVALYTSQSNQIHVSILPQHSDTPRHFLIKFQMVGCADLNQPPHAWYQRQGDEAVVGCKSSRQEKTWHLRCVDNRWQGVVGNCSAPVASQASSHMEVLPFSTEVSITIIIGIAVIFAMIVLVIGGLYIRNMRRHKTQYTKSKQAPASKQSSQSRMHRSDDTVTPKRTRPNSAEEQNPAHLESGRVHSQSASDITSVGTGNAYTHIWERPLPDPHGHQVTSDSDYASQSNYSGATRQSKTTGGYDTADATDSLYNVEGCGSRDSNDNTTPGIRYFMADKE